MGLLGLDLGLGLNLGLGGSETTPTVTAAALYGSTSHTGQFIGCSIPAGPTVMSAVTTNPYDACNSECKSYKYSYTGTPTNDGDSVPCTCSDTLSNTLSDWATSAGTTCSAGVYTVQDISTPYSYQSCYSTTSINTSGWPIQQPSECFETCESNRAAYAFTTQNTAGAWECYCSTSAPSGSSATTCGKTGAFNSYYTNITTTSPPPPPPTATPTTTTSPSQAAGKKRKLEELAAKKRRALTDYCPKGRKACRIEMSDAYECLDISTELEQCGGCRYGSFSILTPRLKEEKIGIDCSRLPGVRMGAVTCSEGRCVVFACKPGWRLEGDQCIERKKKVGRLR